MRQPFFTRLISPSLALILGSAAAGASGCIIKTNEPASCVAERFEGQSRSRFVVGQTFYLPSTGSGCGSAAWKLASAPAGNANKIVAGADGIARFTPHTAGTYEFSLEGSDKDEKETLTVIGAEGLPFHNLNYYPSASVAEVNGEIWSANVFAPTLTRLDAKTLAEVGTVSVGAWPVAVAWAPGMTHAVVAQRGGDTLGLVSVADGRIEDAIWVGDEPTNVVVTADGKTAFVALATEHAVAIVDIEARAVRARAETSWDPVAMAVSKDGATLYVASHRSGHPSRFPFTDDPAEEEKDITVIDARTGAVTGHFLDVGATINGLLLSDDGSVLYMATTLSDPSVSLTDQTKASFAHVIKALDAKTGQEVASADLTRQATSKGYAVTTHQMALHDGKLWVAIEGSDLALALDPKTLEEVARVAAPGRPRGLTAAGSAVFVHGALGFSMTRIEGGEAIHASTGADPRPELVARGQAFYTGAGKTYGQNHACNSCHADGLTDTLIWKAGPFDFRAVTRPQFWLEGAERLGWSGYVDNVKDFAWSVTNTIGVRPVTEEAEGLHAYLASLMPPPAANGKTRRDGALSEEALRGKAVFEGKGACTACHALPLGTNQLIQPNGITPETTDVPSLVGAYRHGVWLKKGEARDLRTAVDMVLEATKITSLTEGEKVDLVRYLEELTARDFFVLATEPKASEPHAVDAPIQVTLSYPVWNDPTNLARIELVTASGEAVPAKVEADGRHVTVTPAKPLEAGVEYTLVVGDKLESLGEQKLFKEARVTIKTAAAPALKLEGTYAWTIHMPVMNKDTQTFDFNNTIPISVPAEAKPTAGGAAVHLDYGDGLTFDFTAVIDGALLLSPALPVPVGPNLADSSGLSAAGALMDEDADGVADLVTGKLTLSGPGFEVPGITWELKRPPSEEACEEGATGALAVAVTLDAMGTPVIDWGAAEGLGLYVTSPGAELPAGPGQTVKNGEAYWTIQREMSPKGFVAPVTYGVLPAAAIETTEVNGGKAGGAALVSGTCYKFSVITTSFQVGQVIMRLK